MCRFTMHKIILATGYMVLYCIRIWCGSLRFWKVIKWRVSEHYIAVSVRLIQSVMLITYCDAAKRQFLIMVVQLPCA